MEKILIIGACGQIGSDLTVELRNKYGSSNVFASDIRDASEEIMSGGPFTILDALDEKALAGYIKKNGITQIYNLAALLSGTAEKMPLKAWDINMKALLNTLEIAKELKLNKIFWPSSIAVFGPTSPMQETPQICVMEPNTVYGISKLAGERWCEYYNQKYNVDVRGMRYPGLISYTTEAGGGTTDYAVEIYYEAIKNNKYECFLSENTALPMMYMPDATKATIDLMEADASKITIRSSYNINGISFTPKEIAENIKKYIPGFEVTYKPDFRQAIADSWPDSVDDTPAQKDWGWKPDYNLDAMTRDMLKAIREKYEKGLF